MCIVPAIMMFLYAGLALGPLLMEKFDENRRNSSGEEDQEKEESQD